MEMDMVSKAFEQAFVSVSQKLLGLQLQRRKQDNGIFLQHPVRQIMICTSGYLRMEIICDMPESMVLQIVSKMYGGGLPPDEQIPLYIKEYINIVCGHGVSSLNNTLKKVSRLSVPFYQSEIRHEDVMKEQMDVIFDTEIGTMQVELHYSGVE